LSLDLWKHWGDGSEGARLSCGRLGDEGVRCIL
jgi:hypothetical protein